MKSVIAEKELLKKVMMEGRKKTDKPSREERFAMKSKMLDEQIIMKGKNENILSPEHEKWML
jgi:hypothetical protein